MDKNNNLEDGRELTQDIIIPRVSNHETPATSLLTIQDYKHLQFKTLSTHLRQNNNKITGKRNPKREADKALIERPTQRKAAPWTGKLNDELKLCTADFTENEKDYDESLDTSAHLIRQPPPRDHNPDTVPLSIVTGVEYEDAGYILNHDDTLSEFYYDKPSRAEEIYNEFAPVCEILN